MVQPSVEYRYSRSAVGRARLFLGAGLVLVAALIVALITGRQTLNSLGLALGIGLVVVMLAMVRAQVGKLGFVLRLAPEGLAVVTPLSTRAIAWSEIDEVRRIAAPRLFGPPAWACAVMIRGPRGPQPVFLFDSELEQAEQAFGDIVSRSAAGVSN